MQCLSKTFCGCFNAEVDESGNELTNNDSIKTNSAIKIQRTYRAFKQRNNEEAERQYNTKPLNTQQKYVNYVSGLPEYTTNNINDNNKPIKKNIEHKKANKKKNNNNNIDNDDYNIFGKKDFIDYYDFLKNNEFKENHNDYSKKNNKSKTTINNNIHSSLDQSNNSNNNNFGAPMGAGKTNEIHSANNIHKNFNKSFQDSDIEINGDIEINDLNDTYSIKNQAPNNLFHKYFDTDNNINQEVNNQQKAYLNMSDDIKNDADIQNIF